MDELQNIEFYQLVKKKIKPLGRKWKVTKSTTFEKKVSRIKRNAEIINKKLNKC